MSKARISPGLEEIITDMIGRTEVLSVLKHGAVDMAEICGRNTISESKKLQIDQDEEKIKFLEAILSGEISITNQDTIGARLDVLTQRIKSRQSEIREIFREIHVIKNEIEAQCPSGKTTLVN